VKQRLLEPLANSASHLQCNDSACSQIGECWLGYDHALIAVQLTAGATIQANPHTVGFLLDSVGPSSHVAILARGLGLPAVSGLQNFSVILGDGQILIDGDTGEVFINPSADTLTRYQKRRSESRANFEVFPPVPQLKVMADIGCVEDISGGSVGACGGYRPLSHGDQSTCSRATAQ